MTEELISRLARYSKECIANNLDCDFASAVEEAIQQLSIIQETISASIKREAKLERELRDCRNTLCLKCGAFVGEHLGACDECRWKYN